MPDYALVLTGPELVAGEIDTIHELLQQKAGVLLSAGPVTLAPSTAAEWRLDIADDDDRVLLAAARAALGKAAADVNVVGAGADRRKRLLIADMDSTIIGQECIDEIADVAGFGGQVAAITERAMRGELDFEDALATRVKLLAGLDVAVLERVAQERLTLTPGAQLLVRTMAAHGAFCALVSGGFTFFTGRIAALAGFHADRANTLEIEDGRLTGRVAVPVLGRQAKLDALHEFAIGRGIPLAQTLAVGDGANDLGMITAAGLGVAYRAKPVVAAEAVAQIEHSDLTALLYLQGYHRSEFIS